jgi:radical SAM superfamily enzyme YgiQ (UPF0313 family)
MTNSILSTIYLGPYKVAHVLREAGYSCLVVNHLSDYTVDELKNLIDLTVGDQTCLVGFSTTFMMKKIQQDKSKPTPPLTSLGPNTVFPQGKEFENTIIDYIKQKNPKIKTMAGGHGVNENYQNKNIDYVLIGYSEISVVNLVNHLIDKDTLNRSYKNIHGRIIIDDRKADTYIFPEGTMSWQDIDVVNHQMLPVEIGRGCIFKCKFCAFPMNGKQQLDFVKTPDNLFNELLRNYNEFGITKYCIVDDTFNDHIEKIENIRDLVKRLPFQPVFWAYIRLDLLCTRPETVQMLYDIGLRSMYFGIETLNLKTGRIIGKGFDRAKQIAMIKHIKDTYPDVVCHGSFIVGLPHESKESSIETFKLLNDGSIPLDSWQFNGLRIYESKDQAFVSDIMEDPIKYGYKDIGNADGNKLPGIVNWQNEFMTASDSWNLANEFIAESRKNNRFKLSGQFAFHLQTMGYDFDVLRTLPHKDFEWHKCEWEVKPAFVAEYKKQLIELIKKKII